MHMQEMGEMGLLQNQAPSGKRADEMTGMMNDE